MIRPSRNAIASLPFLPKDEFKCHYENGEIIDLWTSAFLAEFERPKTACAKPKSHKTSIAFGRTTHCEENSVEEVRHRTTNALRSRTPSSRISLFAGTKLSQNRALEALKKRETILAPVTGQESKFRGQQLHNFKIDLSKAKEKRKRQLQYSREVASGSNTMQREIDSISRIVVQGFRKLIDCERCALFLMDEAKNELFFKPVGDSDHSHARLKPIRFPASSGVAGWVASNKMMCNIKNAYHDIRFNPEIDKVTGFRTRTILCYPVLSSTHELLGVIQMVNKRKGDAKELAKKAKNTKSDDQNKGYQSQYESFSKSDEEILGKCCVEVSKSLEEIFTRGNKAKKEDESTTDGKSSSNTDMYDQPAEDYDDDVGRKSANNNRRRSSLSLGSLAQFVRRHSTEHPLPTNEIPANEAAHTFKFR